MRGEAGLDPPGVVRGDSGGEECASQAYPEVSGVAQTAGPAVGRESCWAGLMVAQYSLI